MSDMKKTFACFGATGGCVGASLAYALREGHYCNALARTPDKLRNFLATEHNISSSTIDQYLTIHEGNAKDPAAVAKALISPTNNKHLVDVIISGVGSYPTFQWSIKQPFPLRDPTICETAIVAMYTAISNLSSSSLSRPITGTSAGKKPLLVVISTAGASKKRGIPLLVYPLYHYFLSSPYVDKVRLEELVIGAKGEHVGDFVIIRPSFLTSGPEKGVDAVRTGWEWGSKEDETREKAPGPNPGWFISRRDVGAWTYKKAIADPRWYGKCVFMTY